MVRNVKTSVANAVWLLTAFIAGYYVGKGWSPSARMQSSVMSHQESKEYEVVKDIYEKNTFDRNEGISVATDPNILASKVTVLLFIESQQVLQEQLLNILNSYPKLHVIISASDHSIKIKSMLNASTNYIGNFTNRGEALNRMLQLVKTPYFLHIDSDHLLGPATSDQSVGWLLHALEQIPQIDVIGGSIFINKFYQGKFNKLEIPCYRQRHFNWTYSETYEYEQSIGDIMICDRTSSSFMARTGKTMKLKFDESLDSIVFADFFLQAKGHGIKVATKPEVMFSVSESKKSSLSSIQHVSNLLTPGKIAFGLKHAVTMIKTLNGRYLDLCDRHRKGGALQNSQEDLLCDYDKAIKQWGISHWAYSGTFAPYSMVIGLQLSLMKIATFLDAKNVTYWIDAGISLGAVKMRAVLPWDSGDIDLGVFMDKKLLIDILQKEFTPIQNYVLQNLPGNQVNVYPKSGFGGLISMFTHKMPAKVQLMRIDVNGYPTPFMKSLFSDLRSYYGITYLQHKMYSRYGKSESAHCTVNSNACLPDFRKIFNGRGGTYREYFEAS